jgi:hypothetical protein
MNSCRRRALVDSAPGGCPCLGWAGCFGMDSYRVDADDRYLKN